MARKVPGPDASFADLRRWGAERSRALDALEDKIVGLHRKGPSGECVECTRLVMIAAASLDGLATYIQFPCTTRLLVPIG